MLNVHGSETKIIEMVEIKNNLFNNSDDDISDLTNSSLSDFLSNDSFFLSDDSSYLDSFYHDNFFAYASMYCTNKITDEMSIFSKASTKVILRYPYNKKS